MDTDLSKQQIEIIVKDIQDQSILQPKRFKFIISKRLIDRFGNKNTAYNKVLYALLWISKNQNKSNHVLTLHAEHFDKQNDNNTWFDLTVEKDFNDFLQVITSEDMNDEINFNSRKGYLQHTGKLFEFEPKSRKATIIMLCLQRRGIRVGFNRVSEAYDRYNLINDKQIYDDVRAINKAVRKELPNVTQFLVAKNEYVYLASE